MLGTPPSCGEQSMPQDDSTERTTKSMSQSLVQNEENDDEANDQPAVIVLQRLGFLPFGILIGLSQPPPSYLIDLRALRVSCFLFVRQPA